MDTFWVIERFENGKSQGYWAGDSSRDFIAEIDNAIHFCRKEDAWRIKRGWHWNDTQVTEHVYLPGGQKMCRCPHATDQSQEWHPLGAPGCAHGARANGKDNPMSKLPDVDPNEPQPPAPPQEAEEKFRLMASRIFTHIVVKGGENNPFRSIREGWFVDMAAPKLQELLRGAATEGD